MIGYINGSLLNIENNTLLVETAGVGYEVEVHDKMLSGLILGNKVTIYIHHHVREDAQTLFGFANLTEKKLFRLVLKVNGVGPKLALAILSCLTPQEFSNAVLQEHLATLQQVKGLGIKVAKRVVIDLKAVMAEFTSPATTAVNCENDSMSWQDAVLVLTRLGYKSAMAERVVFALKDEANDLDHLIRISLKSIAKETSGAL
jgi:holliday junction DNA helicase RuvA